jgi:hypothetical protein
MGIIGFRYVAQHVYIRHVVYILLLIYCFWTAYRFMYSQMYPIQTEHPRGFLRTVNQWSHCNGKILCIVIFYLQKKLSKEPLQWPIANEKPPLQR